MANIPSIVTNTQLDELTNKTNLNQGLVRLLYSGFLLMMKKSLSLNCIRFPCALSACMCVRLLISTEATFLSHPTLRALSARVVACCRDKCQPDRSIQLEYNSRRGLLPPVTCTQIIILQLTIEELKRMYARQLHFYSVQALMEKTKRRSSTSL